MRCCPSSVFAGRVDGHQNWRWVVTKETKQRIAFVLVAAVLITGTAWTSLTLWRITRAVNYTEVMPADVLAEVHVLQEEVAEIKTELRELKTIYGQGRPNE